MRILIVGGGGREHALCWRLGQSASVDRLYAAPGNAGIGELATLVHVSAGRSRLYDTTFSGPTTYRCGPTSLRLTFQLLVSAPSTRSTCWPSLL